MRWLEILCGTICCVAVSVLTEEYVVEDAPVHGAIPTEHVIEYDNVTLECNTTTSDELGGYFWVRNDTDGGGDGEVYDTGWSVELVNVSRLEAGIYLCMAMDNTTGENVTFSATRVDVQYAPGPATGSVQQYLFRLPVGGNVSMSFSISANPGATYAWSRDVNKPFGDVLIRGGKDSTSMTIFSIGIEDFGNYTLALNNSIGSYIAHFTILASGFLESPYDLRAANVSATSVDLTWRSGYDMGSHQRFLVMMWIGDQYMQISSAISKPYKNGGLGVHWSIHLSGLKSGTGYQFEILAENEEGFAFSRPVIFNTTGSQATLSTTPLVPTTTPSATSSASHVNKTTIIAVFVPLTSALAVAGVVAIVLLRRRRRTKTFLVQARHVQSSTSGFAETL